VDRVFIKDLLVRGIIGINDWERRLPQDILINIMIYTDIGMAVQRDSIEECINYSTLAKKVVAHSERVQRHTVEALATDIAAICLDNQGVQKVWVKVEKPGAVRFSKSVGVEIERDRGS
jgi:FolB domain-containing protein